jgi:nucleotide-binding universal stress UspA family protein
MNAMASAPAHLILLPVDGSPSATRAAQHAAVLAKGLNCTVLLLNVQPEVEEWQTHGIGRQAALDHLMVLAKAASADASRALADAGVAFESAVEHGDPAEAIARVAAERRCAFVVMGTRGQGELKGLLMGSVGMKLIHRLQVPITFVH